MYQKFSLMLAKHICLTLILMTAFSSDKFCDAQAKTKQTQIFRNNLNLYNLKTSCNQYFNNLREIIQNQDWQTKILVQEKEFTLFVNRLNKVATICKENEREVNGWLLRDG